MKLTNMPTTFARLILVLGLTWCAQAMADQLVYTPTNPTFGGNPLNASGLQANATAQNNYKAPVDPPASALDKFNAQLTSAILNRLSANAVNTLFNQEGKLLPGSSVIVDNYKVSIGLDAQGNLTITTTDLTNTGSSTTIVVGNASLVQ